MLPDAIDDANNNKFHQKDSKYNFDRPREKMQRSNINRKCKKESAKVITAGYEKVKIEYQEQIKM